MRGERVLYVDDDEARLDLVEAQLRRRLEEIDVGTTVDPTDVADDPDRLDDVDCLVTDYDMPALDGIELLERVRENYPDLPVILYTGHGSETVASRAISADATDYVQKESGTDHYDLLANRVRTAIDHYRATRRVEEAARRRERIVQRITERFVAVDSEWQITEINDKGASGFTDSRDELIGEHYLELAQAEIDEPVDDNPFVEIYREAMATQEPTTIVAESGTEPGTWLEARAYPSEDGVSIFGRDVTERKRREERLRQLHETATRLESCESREAVFRTGVAMAAEVLDLDMCVFSVAKDRHLVPTAVSDHIPEGGVGRFPVDEGLAGTTYTEGEGFLVDDVEDHPAADPLGDYGAAISLPLGEEGIFQAVSEESGCFDETDYTLARLLVDHVASALARVARTDKLRQQNELLDDFASMVSHDLQNGLTLVEGRLDLAGESVASEEAAGELAEAEAALSRLQTQVEDMLEFARQGQPVTDTEFVPLQEAVQDAWRGVRSDGASLSAAPTCRIEADPDRLIQLLENLFENAVEHASTSPRSHAQEDAVEHGSAGDDAGAQGDGGGDGSGAVTVEVGTLEDGFYVADDGPGIPTADREVVFERGYTTHETGTGYGLSLVAEIADAHGWDVAVTDAEGGGARFEVTGVETAP